jgi:hypothetical protein
MALGTLGTNANNSLASLVWNPMSTVDDVSLIAAHILGQSNPTHPIAPGAFSKAGRLHFPGRFGFVLLKPGDVVAYDHFGWPIFVSSESIADGSSSWHLV